MKGLNAMDYHISTIWLTVILILACWEAVWKGVALWRASRHRQLGWFIAILVINSAGLLPIAYLLFWAPGQGHGKD
ncbi:MAG: DUF5652 family protein [Candidatus Saccharimonadales bacterium]